VVLVAGNHDRHLEGLSKEEKEDLFGRTHFLVNEHCEVAGLRVFGSPCSSGRSGNNAFQSEALTRQAQQRLATGVLGESGEGKMEVQEGKKEEGKEGQEGEQKEGGQGGDLEEAKGAPRSYAGVDVLVSHAFSRALLAQLDHYSPPALYVWGHYHEGYGVRVLRQGQGEGQGTRATSGFTVSVCGSVMDKHYNPTRVPIVLDLPQSSKR
jgi:hypothetical protein